MVTFLRIFTQTLFLLYCAAISNAATISKALTTTPNIMNKLSTAVQPIEFHADSISLNQKNHEGIYKGHVTLDQGTAHVRAAAATTTWDEKNQLIKASATGTKTMQAHYWQQTTAEKPPLHAYADLIYYYPERHLIELIGHARVTQNNNSLSAPHITYDTLTTHVTSTGNTQERTTIIIYPEKKA